MRVKTVHKVGMLVLCGLVVAGSKLAAGEVAASSPREIAAKPELVVVALRGQSAEDSAAIVVQFLAEVFVSDWSESKKRECVIALITYAVAAKGMEAAPMMGIVAARVPSAWLPVIAATAVLAAGDHSPAVAKAMLAAVADNAQASAACRAACENPSTVLSPTEIGTVRGIILPTPSAAPAKAPPLPTIIRPAEQYSGQ
jgi:hypothetical protein